MNENTGQKRHSLFPEKAVVAKKKVEQETEGATGERRITFVANLPAWRLIAKYALDHNMSKQDVLEKAINMLFESEGLPPICQRKKKRQG